MQVLRRVLLAIVAMGFLAGAGVAADDDAPPPKLLKSTADHGKFKELQQTFTSGPEVTKACLACHNTAGHQVMKSIHWTWEANSPTTGKKLGK